MALTTYDDQVIREAVEAGALGFLNKDADPETIAPAPSDGLTEREVEVLQLVAQGMSKTQVAHTLVVSMNTVKTHVNHLLAEIGCGGRAALVTYAYRHRLTED